jgi:DNA-binding IclR family transcriptional regulator
MARLTCGPKNTPQDRYRVPILDRTLDLLELLTQHPDGMTVTAMTEALGIPKNSVFRIATTLVLRGYAEREETSKVYRVSRKLLSLGYAAVEGERLVEAASTILPMLRDATGETALLGTLAGSHGVVLDQVASSHPVKVVVEVGHAFPLHTAAPAKAILAQWKPEARNAVVGKIEFKRYTRRTITSVRVYLQELERVAVQGYASDLGEESESFACAAAPVFDARGNAVAAVWISGPSDRVTERNIGKLAAIVKRFARELSRKLGFSAPA